MEPVSPPMAGESRRPRISSAKRGPARDHARAAARRERDIAPRDALRRRGRRAQRPALEDLRQRDAHLHLREGGAEAAPHAAAERDPGVGRGRVVEEALGPEGVGLRVAVGARVGEPDRGRHVRPGGQHVAVDTQLLAQAPARERDHRPQPQRLGHDGAHVGLLAGVDRRGEPVEDARMAEQQVERPRQAGRGRLVPGEQQRHQLVADLGVVHRLAVLEARAHEQRQDVLARVRAALGDLRAQHRVDLVPERLEPGERVGAAEAAREQHGELQPGRRGAGQQPAEAVGEPRAAGGVGDAEDRAQDHLERDRLHPRMQRERLLLGPALDLPRDGLAHDRLVRAHALAVERRQHQLAAREVLAPLEQQQRARAHDRLQRDGPPGRQRVARHGVERPDRLGIREHHHRRLEAEEADAEGVAEAPAAGLEERDRAQQPAQGLHDRRL